MDFGVRLPIIHNSSYPIRTLNPKAKGNIVIGKKSSLDKDYKEHRNMAIAAIASAAIMFVAATVASFVAFPFLVSAFSTSALLLSAGGSAYFVTTKLLDPRAKIEDLKDHFRDALLQNILKKNSDEIEGYDLLQKAIEDRTDDPKKKEIVYSCVRQLRRNYQQIQQAKVSDYQKVETVYKNYFDNLLRAKNGKIRDIYDSGDSDDVKRSRVSDVKSFYRQKVSRADGAKSESIENIQEQYRDAINGLEKQYEKLLNGLGSKTGWPRAIEIGVKGGRIIGDGGKKVGSAIGWGYNRAWEMGKWAKNQL